jgi:hypothetical protein
MGVMADLPLDVVALIVSIWALVESRRACLAAEASARRAVAEADAAEARERARWG